MPGPPGPRIAGSRQYQLGSILLSGRDAVIEATDVTPPADGRKAQRGTLACAVCLRTQSQRSEILSSRNGARAISEMFREKGIMMATGTIKKVVSDRGFGFIAADDGKEYRSEERRVGKE